MSQFNELVAEWHKLMCIEENSAALETHGISQIREDRVLDLTARYIDKLTGIQQQHDDLSSGFASRVRPHLCRDVIDDHTLELTCNRFLAGVGMTFRREIPAAIPRSRRTKIRRLVIRWKSGCAEAFWEGVDVSFPLRELLLFCAEHSGGADDVPGQEIADQLMFELHDGSATIPRLTWVSHDDRQSVLHWETAVVSLNAAAAVVPESTSGIAEAQQALATCIEDSGRDFEFGIHECLSESNDPPEDLNVEVAFVIADAEEPDDDNQTRESVRHFVMRTVEHCGANEELLIRAFSSSAYRGVAEAIVAKRSDAIINQRAVVLKSLRRLIMKKRRNSRPDGELV